VRDEGANQQILGAASDVAGNVGSGSISISLDKTAPNINAVVPSANPFGWYNTDITVGFNAEDTLSGVDSVSGPVTLTDEGESQPVSGRAVDRAGNQATATTTVNIDKTPPTVTATAAAEPNSHGWYRSDVIFNVSAVDSLSGVASVDTPVTVGSEGANQLVPSYATDKAGNVGAATATVNIDKTAPDVQVNGVTNNGVYTLNQAVSPSWTADDLLSGVESIVPSGSSLDTGSVGEKTFSVTATDNAGNANTVTITYNVVYNFGGILQPINPAGSSVFKLGSTVPVKFQLTDSDKVFVSTALAKIYYAKIKDNIVGTNVEAVSTSNATTGNLFRYDLTNNQYIFNLSTKSGFSPGTYQISIILDDGSPAKTVEIGLK
ncbi:MAG TPA: PxKF domain-containing protein, partial [Verrucomicrobiae bacterium]|nr:PxKF domain-containing protein [Verrucomicrobiae bacterium]